MSSEHASSAEPTNGAPIRSWSGAVPILMSAVVLLMFAADLWQHGLHQPHHDEGTADHIGMLLMFGQFPIIGWFVASGRHHLRRMLPTLAIQLTLWAITYAAGIVLG